MSSTLDSVGTNSTAGEESAILRYEVAEMMQSDDSRKRLQGAAANAFVEHLDAGRLREAESGLSLAVKTLKLSDELVQRLRALMTSQSEQTVPDAEGKIASEGNYDEVGLIISGWNRQSEDGPRWIIDLTWVALDGKTALADADEEIATLTGTERAIAERLRGVVHRFTELLPSDLASAEKVLTEAIAQPMPTVLRSCLERTLRLGKMRAGIAVEAVDPGTLEAGWKRDLAATDEWQQEVGDEEGADQLRADTTIQRHITVPDGDREVVTTGQANLPELQEEAGQEVPVDPTQAWTALRELLGPRLDSDPGAQVPLLREMIEQLREWLAGLPVEARAALPQLRYRQRERRRASVLIEALPGSASVPSTLEELRAQLTTNEGRFLGLCCNNRNVAVSYAEIIALLWPGEPVSESLKMQVRRLTSMINGRLRQGQFQLGIILPADDGPILMTEAPFPLSRLDGVHSDEQRKAALYLGHRDRQIIPYDELHQEMFAKELQTDLDRRRVQKVLRKVRNVGFTIIHTGKEENGCLVNLNTNIPHDMKLASYDDYVLLSLLLRASGGSVERSAMVEELRTARSLLRTRTELQPNSLHLAVGRLGAVLGERGTLTMRRQSEDGGQGPAIISCTLQWRNALSRPELGPSVVSRPSLEGDQARE